MAAPIASQIFGEVLPYMDVYKNEAEEVTLVTVPNVINMTIKEAKKALNDAGLDIQLDLGVEIEANDNNIVTDQLPKEGIKLNSGTKVYLSI